MAHKNVLVVMGYGIVLDSPLGNLYLPRIASWIDENRPDLVILCGGQTQKKTAQELFGSPMSEAQVMDHWLAKWWDKKTGQDETLYSPVLLEQDSYTTTENIRNASRLIEKLDYPKDDIHITIFCEAQRALKVIMLSREYMLDLVENCDSIQVETVNWERANPVKEALSIIKWLLIKGEWSTDEGQARRRRSEDI